MLEKRLYSLTAASTPSKFVWIRVPKTGTRTILALLREQIAFFDIEQGFKKPMPHLRYHDHFKFTFVRNPYARLISGWKDKVVLGGSGGGIHKPELLERFQDFDVFVDWLVEHDPADLNPHFRPQSLLVPDEVDFVGRTETLNQDLKLVLKHIGLPVDLSIPHHNKSGPAGFSIADVAGETLEKINLLLEPDFKRFGYAMYQ